MYERETACSRYPFLVKRKGISDIPSEQYELLRSHMSLESMSTKLVLPVYLSVCESVQRKAFAFRR